MSEITPFDFRGQKVRVVTIEGNPWFVANEVCRVLGLDTSKVARTVSGDEKDRHVVPTPGGPQNVVIISESGLYKLVMRSDKAEARQFQDWVTRDVLPAIQHSEASRLTRTNFHPLAEVAGG